MRRLLAAATGALLGGSAAAVLAADPQDAQRLVNDLIPGNAQVVDVFENTGHPLIVGGYFFQVEAEGLTREQFLAQVEEVKADIDGIEVSPGGVTYNGRRGRVELYVHLQPPADAVVQATPTGPSILLYSLGGAAAGTAAAAALSGKRHQGRRARPPLADGHDEPA